MKKLEIYINDQIVSEFDREITLDEQQLTFLNKMDSDMDNGIKIQGRLFTNPDSHQRATFVSMNIIKALQQENEASSYASCAYLVNRLPQLIEVHANDDDGTININLVVEST